MGWACSMRENAWASVMVGKYGEENLLVNLDVYGTVIIN
jgi:hypothetical protein